MSLPLLDDALWGFVCLGLPPAGVTSAACFHCALRAHTVWRGESGALPRRAPSWLAGPRVPCFASAARYARAARRRGRLRLIGVARCAAFFSATAVGVRKRAVAMLRVLLRSLMPAAPIASAASSLLSSLVRARFSTPTATALPVVVGLGSPSARRGAFAPLDVDAPDPRPTSRPTDPPCDLRRRGFGSLRSQAQSPAPTPSALKGTNHK